MGPPEGAVPPGGEPWERTGRCSVKRRVFDVSNSERETRVASWQGEARTTEIANSKGSGEIWALRFLLQGPLQVLNKLMCVSPLKGTMAQGHPQDFKTSPCPVQ